MTTVQEPKGIGFFNIKTGDTHYCKLEPTIAAYINSSDIGINASRGQDYGWRIDPEWVKKVKDFRRDATRMQILSSQQGGQKPTTVQILFALYEEELRNYREAAIENESPYEQQYQDAISGKKAAVKEDDITSVIDGAVAENTKTKPSQK